MLFASDFRIFSNLNNIVESKAKEKDSPSSRQLLRSTQIIQQLQEYGACNGGCETRLLMTRRKNFEEVRYEVEDDRLTHSKVILSRKNMHREDLQCEYQMKIYFKQ
jgi:hypothetical protein